MPDIQSFGKKYGEHWDSQQELYGIAPINVIAPLTGGGLDLDAAIAIQEYIAWCKYHEGTQKTPEAFESSYQREMLEHIMTNTLSAIKALRREGKTYEAGEIVGTLYTASGYKFINAMPTLLQGSRLVFREVGHNIRRLAVQFPELTNRLVDSQQELFLATGGRMLALSADAGAEKEGYGGDYLLIDESHKTDKTTLGIFQPFIRRAIRAGHGRICLIGVGELKDSALDQAINPEIKSEFNYASMVIRASDIKRTNPERSEEFEREEATLPTEGLGSYAQMYEMVPISEGAGFIFPDGLRKEVRCDKRHSIFKAGWDPGKRADESRVAVAQICPSLVVAGEKAITIRKVYKAPGGMSYVKQAEWFGRRLRKDYPMIYGQDFQVEYNGVGDGALDCLRAWEERPGYRPYGDAREYWANGFWEDLRISAMQLGHRLGYFAVEPDSERRELERLTYERDKAGKYQWEHNDVKSSIVACLFGV